MRDGHTGFVYILEGEGSFVGEVASVHDCLILSNDKGEDGGPAALMDLLS